MTVLPIAYQGITIVTFPSIHVLFTEIALSPPRRSFTSRRTDHDAVIVQALLYPRSHDRDGQFNPRGGSAPPARQALRTTLTRSKLHMGSFGAQRPSRHVGGRIANTSNSSRLSTRHMITGMNFFNLGRFASSDKFNTGMLSAFYTTPIKTPLSQLPRATSQAGLHDRDPREAHPESMQDLH